MPRRALGLFYATHSAHSYGLHVIETQDHREIWGRLRILCSMQDVLVYVNRSWFFEGHRLDLRSRWIPFQRCYNLGHFDSEFDQRNRCTCHHPALSRGAPLIPTVVISNPNKPLSGPPSTRGPSITSTHSVDRSRRSSQASLHLPGINSDNNSAITLIPVSVQRQSTVDGTEPAATSTNSRPVVPQRHVTELVQAATANRTQSTPDGSGTSDV